MFIENYIIKGIIVCETVLHIGGSNDSIDIGGSDNPVIRDSISNLPYIPGSSLKGKLRTLLELYYPDSTQSVLDNGGKPSTDTDCVATQIFGIAADNSADNDKTLKFPTRIIVRDAYPTEETVEKWEKSDNIINGAELKIENTIDRIKSSAMPRNFERVPRGSEFNFEIIFSRYEDDENNFKDILKAMELLEDNYLGGSGSRGYGKIRFKDITISKRDVDYYINAQNEDSKNKFDSISEAISEFNE